MSALSQAFPPSPRFTEKDVPDQQGKVFLITGSSSGLGKDLAGLLYGLNAKVYIVARSKANGEAAIADIRAANPKSKGDLVFLPINLDDLPSVKAFSVAFLEKENRLDGLWHNAGVMFPPTGSKTKQGYDLVVGVHCIATYLLTELLMPTLVRTAATSKPGSVRVNWVSSSYAELGTSKHGAVDLKKWDPSYTLTKSEDQYGQSKAAMVMLAQEYAKSSKQNGVVHTAMNPGNLQTNISRHTSRTFQFLTAPALHKSIYGAYTELFAGLSPQITVENSGCWVIPWGRIHPIRKDIRDAAKSVSEGGTGLGLQVKNWCAEQTKEYLP